MEPSRIRTVDLLDRIERGEKTVLIDTRNPKAWAESDQKLPGALRIPAN
jgi:rhodanese-related sulfurtransferase